MAFSLEAALVVPLVISSWLGLTMACVPKTIQVCQAAGLEEQAIVCRMDSSRLYQAVCLRDGSVWTTGLKTSPQAVLELFTLIRDDGQLTGRHIPGLISQENVPAGAIP